MLRSWLNRTSALLSPTSSFSLPDLKKQTQDNKICFFFFLIFNFTCHSFCVDASSFFFSLLMFTCQSFTLETYGFLVKLVDFSWIKMNSGYSVVGRPHSFSELYKKCCHSLESNCIHVKNQNVNELKLNQTSNQMLRTAKFHFMENESDKTGLVKYTH